jgi:hypothetical protein
MHAMSVTFDLMVAGRIAWLLVTDPRITAWGRWLLGWSN